MCLYVHARRTTGDDGAARRAHVYASTCAQCGVALTPQTHVAAHVVAHPLGCGCCGVMTLRTTCKACNHTAHPRPRFWGLTVRCRRLRWVWRCGVRAKAHADKKEVTRPGTRKKDT